MTITQTVEIPADRRLTIDVPPEIPTGKVILTFKPALEPSSLGSGDQGSAAGEETEYKTLSKECAVSMTAEVITKYRPALEELAK